MIKSDGRKLSRQALEQHRFRAIELRKKKWGVGEIAESLGLHRGSVSRWFTRYKRNGKTGLKLKKAKGMKPKLSTANVKKMISWLKHPATEFGFQTPLWTCQRLQQLIKKKFYISLSISNIWRWLQKLGFTNQRPERRALEQNKEEVERWLKEEWPKIKAHARRWQAILYFQDEAGVSLTAVLGKTWAPKGETPIVMTTGNRGSICVTSVISPVGRMLFRLEKEKERINAEKHIEFLQQVLQHHPKRKIVMIEDQARPHIAKKVRNFVEQHKKRFALYYLPSYSPELNPDEHVWNYLKNQKLKAHSAQNMKDFKKLVLSKLRSIQMTTSLVTSFFNNTYVT
jgi:transposase